MTNDDKTRKDRQEILKEIEKLELSALEIVHNEPDYSWGDTALFDYAAKYHALRWVLGLEDMVYEQRRVL